uniref:Glyoxalase/bleomycin resistance protein/dioxygenase n=1 Tax=uncultured bacterium 213 TaxID=698383 RepID=E3T6W5_9BACT|nr:glyoxalase/bleomycin resistance protein/dioxygenase [uncultured bacterium 213]
MPQFTSHKPGTFCWPELVTTDQKGAVAFYREVFDWDVDDRPIGEGATYSMFKTKGESVGAAYGMDEQMRGRGVPPHWGSYVSVVSADEAAKRAKELGATVLMEPFDVMDAGRMAVLRDPTGAVFSVWQPAKHFGAGLLGEPGSLCWTELATSDTNAAEKFYTSLFGWTAKTTPAVAPGVDYIEISNQGAPQAGMMPLMPQMGDAPSHWMPYFAVSDCDATVSKVQGLGGRVYMPPTEIPKVGRFAMVADPQGAGFAVITLAPR